MPDDENLENLENLENTDTNSEEQVNPYKATLDQLITQFNNKFRYIIVSEEEKYPEIITSQEVGNWNQNVDLYWKWEAGGNQPPIDPDNPEPESKLKPYPRFLDNEGDDLPVDDIVVSRNEVIKLIRKVKRRYFELDRNKEIDNATEPIDWDAWQEIEDGKYICLDDAANQVLLLDSAKLKPEWTSCKDDLPPSYNYVLTSNKKGMVRIHFLDQDHNWINFFSGERETEEILAWMFLPYHYEEETK